MKNEEYNLDGPKFAGVFVYFAVALWFCFALWMAAEGRYAAGPRKPPLALGLTLVLPFSSFIFAYTRHKAIWAFCQTLDLKFIVLAHFWRIMAIDFVLCCVDGRLPAGFALPAGFGDIITGLAAIPLAFGLAKGASAAGKRFVAWNIFGMLDLVLAVSLGILHSPSSIGFLAGSGPTTQLMSELPRSMAPTFLVPLFMLLHLLALARRKEVSGDSVAERRNIAPIAFLRSQA